LIFTSKKLLITATILILFGNSLAACIQAPKRLSQEQVLDIVWTDFRPSTSSQNRSNWDNTQVSLVTGREVVSEFSVVPISKCPGPALPENRAIRASSNYWFVRVAPKTFTPTDTATMQLGDEVVIPEPLIQQASYLVDSTSGEIVARRLFCER
jgi:hypothetical protein